jgi:hypothetical protein
MRAAIGTGDSFGKGLAGIGPQFAAASDDQDDRPLRSSGSACSRVGARRPILPMLKDERPAPDVEAAWGLVRQELLRRTDAKSKPIAMGRAVNAFLDELRTLPPRDADRLRSHMAEIIRLELRAQWDAGHHRNHQQFSIFLRSRHSLQLQPLRSTGFSSFAAARVRAGRETQRAT